MTWDSLRNSWWEKLLQLSSALTIYVWALFLEQDAFRNFVGQSKLRMLFLGLPLGVGVLLSIVLFFAVIIHLFLSSSLTKTQKRCGRLHCSLALRLQLPFISGLCGLKRAVSRQLIQKSSPQQSATRCKQLSGKRDCAGAQYSMSAWCALLT